jgi:hypothetical protein
VDYVGDSATPDSIDFGTQSVGSTGTPVVVTIRSDGSSTLDLGPATIAGLSTDAFQVTADGCASHVLSPDQTCTVSVAPHASAGVVQNALLRIPDNTVGQAHLVHLSLTGQYTNANVIPGPTSLSFGAVRVGTPTAAQSVDYVATGHVPSVLGQASIGLGDSAAFGITEDGCSGTTLSLGHMCTIKVQAHPTAAGPQSAVLILPDNSAAGSTHVQLSVTGEVSAAGTYHPITPYRVVDTRTGQGVTKPGPLGAGQVLHVAGAGGGGQVADSGVEAVVLNVTVTGPTAASYLSVYPTGSARPTVSSLNFKAGWTGANNVTVPVGTGGQVDIYNFAGTTHVIVDILGYYDDDVAVLPAAITGHYQVAVPVRVLDTREAGAGGPLSGGAFESVWFDFGPDINPHVQAVAINLTAVNPQGRGFLTTWSGEGAVPLASTLNFAPHSVVPNMAIVPVTPCTDPWCDGIPSIAVYNGSGLPTDFLVDNFGFFDDGSLDGGLIFHPITPTRIADTRIGLGAPGVIGPRATASITAPPTVATFSTWALAANVTAVAPTASTYLSVWPDDGSEQPVVSTVNATAGQTVPNAAIIEVGPTNAINVFNHAGKTNVLIDVAGTFDVPPGLTAATRVAPSARGGNLRPQPIWGH